MIYICITILVNEATMDSKLIFKKSIDTLKDNFIIIVPPMITSLIITLILLLLAKSGVAPAAVTGGKTGASGQMTGMPLIVGILFLFLWSLSHSVVVAMAKEALDSGRTTFNSGIETARDKFGSLILSSFLISVIVMVTVSLFIIPGLVASFFLMFTFAGIIADHLSPLDAMKKSFTLVRSNLRDSAVIFLGIVLLGFLYAFASLILTRLPILGQLISLGVTGTFWGYISIVIVRAYHELVNTPLPPSS